MNERSQTESPEKYRFAPLIIWHSLVCSSRFLASHHTTCCLALIDKLSIGNTAPAPPLWQQPHPIPDSVLAATDPWTFCLLTSQWHILCATNHFYSLHISQSYPLNVRKPAELFELYIMLLFLLQSLHGHQGWFDFLSLWFLQPVDFPNPTCYVGSNKMMCSQISTY